MSLGAFCVQLDSFALNLALPAIRADLHGSAAAARWAVGGYLLAAGSLMPAAGRLADIFGRRRLLALGLVLFAAASALCALSPTLPFLAVARVAQGVGGALIMPAGLALLTNSFPPERRRAATAGVLALAGLATACGPFVGGVLAQTVSWRALFWLGVPLCAAAAGCALRGAESRDPYASRVLDRAGAATGTGALACLAMLSQSGAWQWAAAALVLLLLFVRAELRSPAPLLDLALFRNAPYVLLTASGTVANAATVVLLFTLPLALHDRWALSPLASGTAFLAPATAMALAGALAGRVTDRAAAPVMSLGLATTAIALWATTVHTSLPALLAASTLAAAFLGLTNSLTLTATQSVVAPARAGEASGVTKSALTTGAALTLTFTTPHTTLTTTATGCAATAAALGAASAVTAARRRAGGLGTGSRGAD